MRSRISSLLLILILILGMGFITPISYAQEQTSTPSLRFTTTPSTTPLVPIVVTGVLVLITMEPHTQTPAPTHTITPTPTQTGTPLPTFTQTATSTPIPPGPVETVISSPITIWLILSFVIVFGATLIFAYTSKLTIADIVRRVFIGKKRTPEIGPSEPVQQDNEQIKLGEEFEPRVWLERSEFKSLVNYIDKIESGNIALAGPRGIGKTTLMQALLNEHEKEHVTLQMSTPTRYDEKEFVLNLYEGLCRSVIDRIKKDPNLKQHWFSPNYYEEGMKRERQNQRRILFLIVGIGCIIFACSRISNLVTALDAFLTTPFDNQLPSTVIGLAIGLTPILFGAIFLFISLSPLFKPSLYQRIWEKSRLLADIYDQTQQRLERIRYEQTIESSVGAEFSLADVLKLGSSSGGSLTRQPYTLVGLVADYRDYVHMVAAQFSKVVIGIDELDKVQDADQAREFLRKIKGVFSLKDTYYIVSVSEEALEAFELRTLFGKDEVDSTFTTIIRLNPLTLKESVKMLKLRSVNRPDIENFLGVISGGIPRDLIRLARKTFLNEEFGASGTRKMIEFIILELFNEFKENIRLNKKISDQGKLIITNLDTVLELHGLLHFGSAMNDTLTNNESSTELSKLLFRLKVRLEIMGFLGDHPEVFSDDSLSSGFLSALSQVPNSPFEARLTFYRLQTKFN